MCFSFLAFYGGDYRLLQGPVRGAGGLSVTAAADVADDGRRAW